MSSSRDSVLLVAHGTVTELEDLPEFLLRIRRGRPAEPALIADLERRYRAIGGSPLLEITSDQGKALEIALGLPVFVAMRLWHPTVEEVLSQIALGGSARVCVLPLAPFSVHVYFQAALAAREKVRDAPELVSVEAWGSEPGFVAAQASSIESTWSKLVEPERAALVLTAHSLPTSVIIGGDPYADQVSACAAAVGERLGRPYELAYQSQGAGGGDWLGPDLKSTLEAVRAHGAEQVVVAPIGFLSEHVETLYDLDIEAAGWARELGLTLHRVPALNDHPALIETLARVARRTLEGA